MISTKKAFKHFIPLIGIFFYAQLVLGQKSVLENNTQTKRVSLTYGNFSSKIIDYTWGRLPQTVKSSSISMYYEKITSSTVSVFHVILPFPAYGHAPVLQNSNTNFTNYTGTITYRKLSRINDYNHNLSCFLGGGASLRADVWFPTSILNYGWDISLGLNTSFTAHYTLHRRLYAQYDLDFGVLGLLFRTPNNGQQLVVEEATYKGGVSSAILAFPRFGHLFNTIYADNRIKVGWVISKNIDLYVGSNISYRNIKVPLPKTGYLFNNHLGFSFKF